MADRYSVVLTALGEAKFAQAIGTRTALDLVKLGVGDGRGVDIVPNKSMRSLVRETWRGGITEIKQDATNPNQIIIEGTIPPNVGGFTVREVGVYDSAGDLIVIANYPSTFKPIAATGADKILVIRLTLTFSNPDSIKAVTIFEYKSSFAGIATKDETFKEGIVRINEGSNIRIDSDKSSNSFKINSVLRDWFPAIDYFKDEFVVFKGVLYRCIRTHRASINFGVDQSANWEALGGTGGGGGGYSTERLFYDIASCAFGNPTQAGGSVELMRFVATRHFKFLVDFPDSVAFAEVGPTKRLDFPLLYNNRQFGVMSFDRSASGEPRYATFRTSGQQFDPKDVFTVMSPIETDPQISGIEWNFAATLY